MRGISLPVWKSKDLKVGGSNLTNINFANLSSQIKLVDTLKYYQQSLDGLSSTATVEEKISIKIWQCLNEEIQDKVLDLIAQGKGVIPNENINTFDSLDSVLENCHFFCSE